MPSSPPAPDIVPLAAGFATTSREQWIALAEKTLKGASIETLVKRTLEDLPIQPLYADAPKAPAAQRATPGWDIRTLVRAADRTAANAEMLQDLAGGASSVLLRLGDGGVAVGSGDEMAQALAGVLLDASPVALDARFLGVKAADWLGAAAKSAPSAPLALHMDPLSAFAVDGVSPGPIEAHLIACAGVGVRLADPYPRASLFMASGRAAHEAGAGEALELAMAATAALAYARALARAGLPLQDAFDRIVLGLSADADYFLSIAKLRAARLLWAKVTGACGVSGAARIEARSSERMLTRADAWTNMIRLTAAAFAGAVGGADSVVLGAFTDAIGPPTPFARRQSRNAQLVLMDEANLGRVADPAAGCDYLDTLADDLARAAWEKLQAIEAAGGLIAALEGGMVAREAQAARSELASRLAERQVRILGVTDFPPTEAHPPATADAVAAIVGASPSSRLPGPDSHCPPLSPIRLEDLA